jgi:hypothetical protein
LVSHYNKENPFLAQWTAFENFGEFDAIEGNPKDIFSQYY